MRVLGFFSFLFVLAIGAPLRAADSADYGSPAGTLVVPDGLKAEEVQKCILEAAAGRGWTVRERDAEKVVITLEQEKWVSKMTLTYSTKEIQIFSRSTKSGKPKLPEGWLKFLKQDINVKLNTLSINKK